MFLGSSDVYLYISCRLLLFRLLVGLLVVSFSFVNNKIFRRCILTFVSPAPYSRTLTFIYLACGSNFLQLDSTFCQNAQKKEQKSSWGIIQK